MIIVVAPGESIQHAIDAARPGDTVLVQAGVFYENVTVPAEKEGLRIVGAGAAKTVLDGTTGVGSGFTVDAASTTIAHFTVRHFAEYGMKVGGPDNVIRTNVFVHNGMDGLRVLDDRNVVKANQFLHNAGHGIYVECGFHNYIIANCIVSNGGDGMRIERAHTVVAENRVWNNARGICACGADGCMFIGNTVGCNRQDGITIDGDYVLLLGNVSTFNAEHGLEVSADGFIAVANEFVANGAAGVYVARRLQQSLFYKNEVQTNQSDGFGMVKDEAAVDTTVLAKNVIGGNGAAGIDFDVGYANRVLDNALRHNRGPGLNVATGSADNVIDDNVIDGNRFGMLIHPGTTNNVIRSNVVRSNRPL